MKINKLQIICAILYLLDKFSIRIGNTVYSKQNNSYGLTTLRKRHLSIEESQAIIEFKGKNAHMWHILLKNKKIIHLLKKCSNLPGYELFKYLDDEENVHIITSQDINSFLHSLTKKPFTAKDFRTWAASRELFYNLTQLSKKRNVSEEQLKATLNEVAKKLGHTPSICQKSYLHPEIIPNWKNNRIQQWVSRHDKQLSQLGKDELLLYWLQTFIK